MRKAFSIALLAGFATPVSAAHWVPVGPKAEGQLYVDTSTIVHHGATFEFVTKETNSLGSTDIARSEINCATRTVRTLQSARYKPDHSQVKTFDEPLESIPSEFARDSIAEELSRSVCNR